MIHVHMKTQMLQFEAGLVITRYTKYLPLKDRLEVKSLQVQET